MRILILNWRDSKNPSAGGAEQLTHEIARRWARDGHQVIQFSAGFPGAKPEETVDGLRIIRLGQWWNVAFWAFFYYILFLRNKIDVIIDEVHWFPYFAKLYAPKKTILLACEVANRRFFKLFPAPLAALFRLIERYYLWLYQDAPAMAISGSTKRELLDYGFSTDLITVIPMGVSLLDNMPFEKKEKQPTIMYLGRLNRLKGAEDAIEALLIIRHEVPNIKLWMVGSGEFSYVTYLKKRVSTYKLEKHIVFHGYVSEQRKFSLLARAHVLIVPSMHEGWGLTVSEATSVGTPSVVYDVPGLRDSIQQGNNGLTVEQNPRALAQGVLKILRSRKINERTNRNSSEYARRFSWNDTAAKALEVIKQYV